MEDGVWGGKSFDVQKDLLRQRSSSLSVNAIVHLRSVLCVPWVLCLLYLSIPPSTLPPKNIIDQLFFHIRSLPDFPSHPYPRTFRFFLTREQATPEKGACTTFYPTAFQGRSRPAPRFFRQSRPALRFFLAGPGQRPQPGFFFWGPPSGQGITE